MAIVVGVLVVVGGGVAAAILLLGGGDEVSTSSPQDTVDSFAQAVRDGDCDALESLVTDRFLEAGAGECDPKDLEEQSAVDFGAAEITEESGESAVAKLVDGDVTYELSLVNEDGSWLIDGFGAGASAPGAPADADGDASQDEAGDGEGEVIEPDLPDSADAQAMLEVYVEALRAGDCAKIEELSSETLNSSTDCHGDIVPPNDVEVEFGDPTLVDTTTAEVPATVDGQQTTITLLLTQDDEGWKVTQLDIR